MSLREAIGWLGSGLLTACAFPLAIETVSTGRADVNAWFLGLWLTGEVVMLVHVVWSKATYPVIVNYAANSGMVGIVGYYKWLT